MSKKIYAKREEYIRKKNIVLMQKSMIEVWKRRLEIKQLNKFTFETRVMQGTEVMRKTMRKKIFGYILDRYEAFVQE